MGGALAIHVCHRQMLPNVAGLIVIDVVEGIQIHFWKLYVPFVILF